MQPFFPFCFGVLESHYLGKRVPLSLWGYWGTWCQEVTKRRKLEISDAVPSEFADLEVSQYYGYLFGALHNKDHIFLGVCIGGPQFRGSTILEHRQPPKETAQQCRAMYGNQKQHLRMSTSKL